jgi:hypothetical protein
MTVLRLVLLISLVALTAGCQQNSPLLVVECHLPSQRTRKIRSAHKPSSPTGRLAISTMPVNGFIWSAATCRRFHRADLSARVDFRQITHGKVTIGDKSRRSKALTSQRTPKFSACRRTPNFIFWRSIPATITLET